LSETLRAELALAGAPIGVSVLCPSATNTNVMESERNRPTERGSEARTEEADQFLQAIKAGFTGPSGLEPDAVAAQVLDAVRHDRFWVLTHADLRPALELRFASILDAEEAAR